MEIVICWTKAPSFILNETPDSAIACAFDLDDATFPNKQRSARAYLSSYFCYEYCIIGNVVFRNALIVEMLRESHALKITIKNQSELNARGVMRKNSLKSELLADCRCSLFPGCFSSYIKCNLGWEIPESSPEKMRSDLFCFFSTYKVSDKFEQTNVFRPDSCGKCILFSHFSSPRVTDSREKL